MDSEGMAIAGTIATFAVIVCVFGLILLVNNLTKVKEWDRRREYRRKSRGRK